MSKKLSAKFDAPAQNAPYKVKFLMYHNAKDLLPASKERSGGEDVICICRSPQHLKLPGQAGPAGKDTLDYIPVSQLAHYGMNLELLGYQNAYEILKDLSDKVRDGVQLGTKTHCNIPLGPKPSFLEEKKISRRLTDLVVTGIASPAFWNLSM